MQVSPRSQMLTTRRLSTAAFLLFTGFSCSAPLQAGAQSALPPASQVVSKAAPAPALMQKAGGPREGIQVSGYWKLDIRNKDGSLAKHLEFENALTPDAANLYLPDVLFLNGTVRYVIPGGDGGYFSATGMDAPAIGINTGLSISMVPSGGPLTPLAIEPVIALGGPCTGYGCLISTPTSGAYNNCLLLSTGAYVFSVADPITSSSCVTSLQDSLLVNALPGPLTLSGSLISDTDNATINTVSTYITVCGGTPCSLPAGTTAGTSLLQAEVLDFTSYTLPTPLPINAGQSLSVSVTISFSSPPATGSTNNAGANVLRANPAAVKPSVQPTAPPLKKP